MRRVLIWTASMLAVLVAVAPHLEACGDKLLVLGRGIRFQSRHTPRAASVLIYLPPGTANQVTDPDMESALREAGHAVHAATTGEELENALRSGGYDVVLTNVTNAPELERVRSAVSSDAVVLPAVYLVAPSGQRPARQQAKADEEKAAHDFRVVIEVPSRAGYYCAAVDKAMELKLKREQSARHQ